MERRVITTDMMEEDIRIEGSLRPQCLDDYIGQEKAKKNLKIYLLKKAAQNHWHCKNSQCFKGRICD